MPEDNSERADKEIVPVRVRSSVFKYYIHDSVEACRLQLLGELSESDVPELSGCWGTARTTLGDRKLVLDLRGLKTVDGAGKQWLATMASDGASFLPENYLRNGLAGQTEAAETKIGIIGKVCSLFRGSRVAATPSSTQ